MVLKLYGGVLTTCAQRVLVVANHLGVEVESIDIDFGKKEHKSPEYMKKQPFGQVPYLVSFWNDGLLKLNDFRLV